MALNLLRSSTRVVGRLPWNTTSSSSSSFSVIPTRFFGASHVESFHNFSTTTTDRVPVDLIKIVRQRTSAGVMECRNALAENKLDVEEAVKFLIKKGQSGANAKKDRTAAEGAIYSLANQNHGTIAELNSETDFVSRGDQFQALAQAIPRAALSVATESSSPVEELSIDKVMAQTCSVEALEGGQQKSLSELISWLRFQIGENISLRRVSRLSLPSPSTGVVSEYTHGKGKYAALVGLEASSPLTPNAQITVKEFGKRLAVQLVGYSPEFLSRSEVTPSILEEKTGGSLKLGSPEAEKWIKEKVLLESDLQLTSPISPVPIQIQHHSSQEGGSLTVNQALKDLAKAVGVEKIVVVKYLKWKVGEGIEKKVQDFAAEVAASAKI